ncbi:hypothetical protein BV898_09036 [Hypsibius exemplaris]|uniref:DUF4773 domain-containing protein n=1 Tax=Hypsibius exemplaris TaxID=2072580 RepID=A0A1W0WNS3_HYPEX|nr:hypothetical protein BV898_09036 [Hypsibius exemplaris]
MTAKNFLPLILVTLVGIYSVAAVIIREHSPASQNLAASVGSDEIEATSSIDNKLPVPISRDVKPTRKTYYNVPRVFHLLDGNGCYCFNDTCACCEHLDIPRFHINDTGCIELVYLRKEIGISLLFLIDNVALINRTVSVHNPPPICYGVPKISMADVCVQFFSLDIQDKLLSGCVRVVAQLADVEIYKKTIGCFRFPVAWRNYGLTYLPN